MNSSHYNHLRVAHYQPIIPKSLCSDTSRSIHPPCLTHNPSSFPLSTKHLGRLNKAKLLLDKLPHLSPVTVAAIERDFANELRQLRNSNPNSH